MLGSNLRKLFSRRKLFAFTGVLLLLFVALAYSIGLPAYQLFASPAQTISFDDLAHTRHPMNGQYPTGVINWGQNTWEVIPLSTSYPSNAIQFARQGMRKASFTFLQPEKLLQFDAYNGGSRTTVTVTLSCAGLPNVSASIPTRKVVSVKTGWNTACITPTLHSPNRSNISFDNFMAASMGMVLPVPTSKPSSPIPTPKSTTAPIPTTVPTTTPTMVSTTTPATPAPTVPTPTPATGGVWKPALDTSWQWQLTTPVDHSLDVQMYDIDGFDNDASVIASLHSQGKKVVCYIDAGTYEDWRPDASQFPSSVKGSAVQGWAGEQWLDIRNLAALEPIMEARLDMCKTKGFDGVEFDNVDGYTNKTGFSLTASDQLTYNSWLAGQAHVRGLSAGLKNDVDQVTQLLPDFDWALDEQCFQYNECNTLLPFINAGKAVFEVEYSLSTSQFCSQANAMNFNSLKKDLDLDATRTACR